MGHPGLLLDGGVVPGAAPRRGLQLEDGRLGCLGLGGRPVEAGLEGVTSQLFSIVWSVVRSLLRSGGLIDPQSPPLGQRSGRG